MPPNTQPRLPLFNFLVGGFQLETLRQVAQFVTPALVKELPTRTVSLSEYAAQYIAALDRVGVLNRDFLDNLREFWTGPPEEIEALKQALFPKATKPRRQAPPPAELPAERTYRHFCIVLDRSVPWSTFKGRCVRSDGDVVFLVHGGHDQDLYLFLERVGRFLSDKRDEVGSRDHTHLAIRSKDARGYPESAGEWGARLRDAIAGHLKRDVASLVDALHLITEHGAALLALHGADGCGLRVSGSSPLPSVSRIALVSFLSNDLPPLLGLKRNHPLRLLIPVEHEPYTKKALPPDVLFGELHRALGSKPWYLRVPELAVPDWPDVLKTIEAVMNERAGYSNSDVSDACHNAYQAAKKKKQSFAVLADALGAIVDLHFPEPTLASLDR